MGCFINYNICVISEVKREKDITPPNMRYAIASKLSYKRVLREFFIDDVIDIILSYVKDFDKVCDCVLNQRYNLLAEEKLNNLVLRNSVSSSLNKNSNVRTLYTVDICDKCISAIYNKRYNYNVFNSKKKNVLNIFVKNTECNIIINARAFIDGMKDMSEFNIVKREYKHSQTKLFYQMFEYYLPDANLTREINKLTAFKRVNIIIRKGE